eukprot:gene11304-11454_t
MSPARGSSKVQVKAVHKFLQEDNFRQATEHNWSNKAKQWQGLDVLQRCKQLNEFLAKDSAMMALVAPPEFMSNKPPIPANAKDQVLASLDLQQPVPAEAH